MWKDLKTNKFTKINIDTLFKKKKKKKGNSIKIENEVYEALYKRYKKVKILKIKVATVKKSFDKIWCDTYTIFSYPTI